MAVGTALAAKMRKIDQVTLYFVGEGTCNQADAHPSMCMASLWQLPVVFAVCTNQYSDIDPNTTAFRYTNPITQTA